MYRLQTELDAGMRYLRQGGESLLICCSAVMRLSFVCRRRRRLTTNHPVQYHEWPGLRAKPMGRSAPFLLRYRHAGSIGQYYFYLGQFKKANGRAIPRHSRCVFACHFLTSLGTLTGRFFVTVQTVPERVLK